MKQYSGAATSSSSKEFMTALKLVTLVSRTVRLVKALENSKGAVVSAGGVYVP